MIPDYTPILNKTVNELSDPASYEGLFHQYKDGELLPSAKSLRRIVELSREILFLATSATLPYTDAPSTITSV